MGPGARYRRLPRPASPGAITNRPTTPAGPSAPSRPAHHRPELLALVAVGGVLGSLARYATGLVLAPSAGWAWGTLAVNLIGAFLLGLLLEGLARRGPETTGRLRARMLLGTGVLGGFTTYSALALDLEGLLAEGALAQAAGYAGLTLLGGLVTAVAGIALARWVVGPSNGSARVRS